MARPPKGTESKRSLQVIFRLTPEEYDRLRGGADRVGLHPNELARQRTLKGDDLIVPACHRYDPAFIKRLDQIGYNLSQIVKNAHLFRQASPLIIEQLCRTIDQIITEALEERPDGP